MRRITRRTALQSCLALGAVSLGESGARGASPMARRFHVSLGPEALRNDPDLLDIVARAGVTHIWIAGYFYGHWPYPIETINHWRREAERRGLNASVINIPLGHPGDSLGSSDAGFPLTPPKDWRVGVRPDGSTYAGTSLHPPATELNVAALKKLRDVGVRRVFLDDDFRLAVGPGVIGGCFCDEHRRAFLRKTGYADARWAELLDNVRSRSLTPIVRDWTAFTCDQLTTSFRAQERALGGRGRLGIMVMYLGAEKAGIRLRDYAGTPLRVGELMFDDASFGTTKGKTDELFSALFHRRFVRPDLAFSETTAYPADRLSAGHMAAKLAVSTIADVRNTMFMSGLTPFPKAHWDVLGPAMKEHTRLHARIAGHRPRGPLKLVWGEHSRMVGDDRPFSLPLALGLPFEVVEKPGKDGWAFLSDADAAGAAAGGLQRSGAALFGRVARPGVRGLPEDTAALQEWKARAVSSLQSSPYLADEGQAVLAWYPTARAALIWNLEDRRRDCALRIGGQSRSIRLESLGLALTDLP